MNGHFKVGQTVYFLNAGRRAVVKHIVRKYDDCSNCYETLNIAKRELTAIIKNDIAVYSGWIKNAKVILRTLKVKE